MKQKIILCVISAVTGFLLGEVKSPLIGLWIDVFGSSEERALKEYQDMQSTSKRDSVIQRAQSWKAEQDSLEQVKEREAFLCIKREIDRSKENPCASSIYYYFVNLDIGINWLIGSTECPQTFPILGYPETMPVALLNRRWVKRYFATQIVREVDIARIFGICQ